MRRIPPCDGKELMMMAVWSNEGGRIGIVNRQGKEKERLVMLLAGRVIKLAGPKDGLGNE